MYSSGLSRWRSCTIELIWTSMVHSRSPRPQLTTTLSIDHNNGAGQRRPVASLSAVVVCCHLWEIRGLENRRPFTRSKGSNPFPSATFSLLSTGHSILVVHWWSISSGSLEVFGPIRLLLAEHREGKIPPGRPCKRWSAELSDRTWSQR